MPLAGHRGRRDADAEEHVAVTGELLQGRGGHRVQRWGAELQREHTGAEARVGRDLTDRAEQRHRLGRVRFRDPDRAVAELVGFAGDVERQRRAEGLQAGDTDGEVGHAR